jgi:predicted Zn-dependent protease
MAAAVMGLLIASLGTACATPRGAPGGMADIAPGQRPSADSDEGGLWMRMDRVETNLKTSGHLVTDPALVEYLRGIVCKLVREHCTDIRLYVVRTPQFNASMAPNGVMQVWTGLLVRTDNEAQLAYVLGHELGHYLRRHSLQLWRDARTKTNVATFFAVLAAAAGQGYAGSLAQLIALGSVFAFSRDNEREADEIGLEVMANAGYDPREAGKIWESLDQERRAGKEADPLVFFATHPPTAERIDALKAGAAQAPQREQARMIGRSEYLAATGTLRGGLLRDELRRRDFARTQVLFTRLLAGEPDSGLLRFFQGELYRLRQDEGDEARAIEAYERAAQMSGVPPEVHRSLGLLLMRRGERGPARAAFERYLGEEPGAEDRAMILSYIESLR